MSRADFKIVKHLGKGSYGSVSLVTRLEDNRQYALKDINVSKMPARDKADELNEIRILASLYHPNILGYYDAFLENGHLFIVLEYADNGDVEHLLKKYTQNKQKVPENTIWSILIEALNALQVLHSRKIIHRDIKTENFLVYKNPDDESLPLIKIADFGVSKVLHTNFTETAIGTPYYLSPEIFECQKYNEKTDVYSLGNMMYELCMQRHPYQGKDMKELQKNVLRGTYVKVTDFYSQELRDTIEQMMLSQPVKRPSVQKLLTSESIQKRENLSPTKIESDVLPGMATLIANGKQSEGIPQPQMLQTIKINAGLNRLMQGNQYGEEYGRLQSKQFDYHNVLPGDEYQKRELWNQLADLHLEHVRSDSERENEEERIPEKPAQQLKTVLAQPQSVRIVNRNVPQRTVIKQSQEVGMYDINGRLRASRRCVVQRRYK